MAMTCDRVRELASGFVLGALEACEMIAISDHLEGCSQPHHEVNDFGGVLPYLAESLEPVEPPAWLRESVIAAAKADAVVRRSVGELPERRAAGPIAIPFVAPAAALAVQGRMPAPAAQIVSLAAARASRRRRAMTWATRVAAAVAVVALAGYAVVLQGDLNRVKTAQDHETQIINALGQTGTLKAVMTANDGSKAGGLAALLPTGHIIVNLHSLAATKGDQVYVVWLSSDGGTPTKVGSFTVDDSGEGYLAVDNVPTSASLWLYVCQEPNGNVTKPTGPMIVSGTISY